MAHFDTPTQYDQAYLGIENNRSVCSFFSLLCAQQFMVNHEVSRDQHLRNLDASVGNYLVRGIQGHLSFFELLEYSTNYSEPQVEATSATMIREKVFGYDQIFLPEDKLEQDYAVVFLKNSKFFVVLVKKQEAKITYHVRDCHELVQYDFETRADLEKFLNERHDFNRDIIIDGFVVGEFSNIEFLRITKPVTSLFDLTLTPPKKSQAQMEAEWQEEEEAKRLSKEQAEMEEMLLQQIMAQSLSEC